MMGGVSPETWWASYIYKRKFDTQLHLVGFSMWIITVKGSHNPGYCILQYPLSGVVGRRCIFYHSTLIFQAEWVSATCFQESQIWCFRNDVMTSRHWLPVADHPVTRRHILVKGNLNYTVLKIKYTDEQTCLKFEAVLENNGRKCFIQTSLTFDLKNYTAWSKSLCTWWLQYRKQQVMFKVSPAGLQTLTDTPNCVLEDRVQYSTVHIPNVFCDGHLQIIYFPEIVRIL
jgi:hypothetical protein